MFKKILSLFIGIGFFFVVHAQTGKIVGKITNNKNEPVAGASVTLDGGRGTTTDIEGRFELTVSAGQKYSLNFSSVGYQSKSINEVEVTTGKETSLDILLEDSKKNQLTEVVVKAAPARRESLNAMIAYQRNTPVVAQVVSAEAIRRSPDKNTGEVLKRVPGTSVQDGKYLIVRGLSDRYNQAMLNGILLSSTEPDRKTFSFDIFPSGMIDNIIINKTFIPELPGEWAGGLVQVNTKDIPSSDFFTIQAGIGFNSRTIGKDFYTYTGGNLDWLGFDDGSRALPDNFPTRSTFNEMGADQKTDYGKQLKNIWDTHKGSAPLNAGFQASGGFNTKLFGKKFGAILAANYTKTNRNLDFQNSFYSINGPQADLNFDYHNNKYSEDVLMGGLANFTMQLDNKNKISIKNLFNVNTSDYTTLRTGLDYEFDPVNGERIRASELAFRQNIYFNTQLSGEHTISKANLRLKWFGAFNILDQYIPDQRRTQYNQSQVVNEPYAMLIANTLSQKSGSRFYSTLSDYIYTAGGDLALPFTWLNNKQTVKGGYFFQVKDRLFDSRPFAIYLPVDNPELRELDESSVFAPENFGSEREKKFGFDEISGDSYRYVANSILNAGFLQFDNQLTDKLRVVWGLRVEHFDQVVGSMKQDDPRHVYSKVLDYLPGLNITYKLTDRTNLRLSGSQTVIRPEFREIAPFAFFDFELGATVLGNPNLKRTKVTNGDLRYEIYPRAGELFTIGVFYKYFDQPIEIYFNQSGVGTSNTFNYLNANHAKGYGAELEMRKKLDFVNALRNFTLFGNFSYIYNRVEDTTSNIDRPMQGQSPYVLNVGLQYDIEKIGLNTTLLFNQIGRRILYVGNDQIPPIWENPRPLLDLQVAKKLLKNKAEIRFNITDLLNKAAYYYHDLNEDDKFSKTNDAVAIKRIYGTTYNVIFAYTIK